MKRLLSAVLIAAALILSQNALADVGCYNNGSYSSSTGMFQGTTHCGPTSDINYLSQAGSAQSTQVGMVRSVPAADPNLFAAGVGQGDATSLVSTTDIIPIGYAYVRLTITSNSDPLFTAKTLANGYPGQLLTIYVSQITPASSAGSAIITPTTSTGFKKVALTAVGDILNLQYVDSTVGWVITGYTGSITITQSSS